MESKKKVLLVEDDALLRASLAAQFETAGFEVITANDGEAGEEAFFSENPAAVVLDIMMPKKDGLEMLSSIRARAPLTKVPFVVLTNSDDRSHVAAAMANDIAAFIPKSDEHLSSVVALVSEKLR